MEGRRNNRFAPIIIIKEMQKDLDFYSKLLCFQAPDKLTRKDGRVIHAAVGFDSPLLTLLPGDYGRRLPRKDDLLRRRLHAGIELHFGMHESGTLHEFFSEVTARGITVIREPIQPNDAL